MELQYYGANCVRISTKKGVIVIDDNLNDVGLKEVVKAGDIALFTGPHGTPKAETKLTIDQPGEYEVSDVSIQGIAAQAHIDEPKQFNAIIYKLTIDDIRVAVVGHVYPKLSSIQLEALGTIDILILPIGGNGYTLDGTGAAYMIKEIEPKIIIPTHYDDAAINYPVPQSSLEETLKTLGIEQTETVPKLKIKSGEVGELTQLVILERQ